MIHIRPMSAADVALGMRLKEQAGWNQREADWLRFLQQQPDGCFVAELAGHAVGTTTTWIFGPVAWVAMVLVDAAVRGKGIGTALMKHALDYLDRSGVRTVRLDATPLGQPIYEKLGFVAEYTLARYAGTLPPVPPVAGTESATSSMLDEIGQLDLTVTGTNRLTFVRRLFAERPDLMRVVRENGVLAGYASGRPGARAAQIGPCIGSAHAAALLLGEAFHRHAGQFVYIDIPLANQPAAAIAETRGLSMQRRLLRMTRGPVVVERSADLWASSGPEKG